MCLLLLATVASTADLPEQHLAATRGTLRMAVVGDVGIGSATVARGIATVHQQMSLDAILLVGDNIYPRGVRSVDDPKWKLLDPLSALGLPIFAVLGNHDYAGSVEAQIAATGRRPEWRLPARNYILRSGVADFAMLDTTPFATGRDGGAGERKCLVCAALAAAFPSTHATWRIAVGHHPVVSSGWHGVFPRNEARRMRRLLPILRSAQVDLYICGHDHHLELMSGKPALLISGAGSDPVPPIALHAETLFPTEISLPERIGFALLEASPTALRVRFYNGRGRPLSRWYTVASRHEA
jgi:tartrate-resistant acid phosphatase type 5